MISTRSKPGRITSNSYKFNYKNLITISQNYKTYKHEIWQTLEQEVLHCLEENNFVEECLNIFVEFKNDKEYKKYLEPNVPLYLLERRSELEVRSQKSGDFHLSPSSSHLKPPPTAELVAAVADVVHNLTLYKTASVNTWNEQGLYRVLFRCTSWSGGTRVDVSRVRRAACAALSVAASHQCVRAVLAGTRDCLHNMIATLTPFEADVDIECISARTQALHLLAALLVERSASNLVWSELKENNLLLLHLLLQALENKCGDKDMQAAAMHCLTQLARSLPANRYDVSSEDNSYVDVLNDYLSPNLRDDERLCAGDSARNDCRPEYIVEEFCKLLMNLYQDISDKQKCLSSQDETWSLVCASLASLVAVCARARRYCVHRRFPRALISTLQKIRDALSLHGKPVDAIRNADHEPTLNTLNTVLTLITCSMLECPAAKDLFAEEVAPSLSRLWLWCMMNEALRDTLMNFLVIFTNDCPKAWSAMCACVGARSLISDVCALVSREAARPRPTRMLPLGLRVLRQCSLHQHCRTVIIKNDMVSIACRARARVGPAWWASARLCEALARRGDGAAALLAALRAPLSAAPAALLPALAHAAHHHRLTFLQSPELLELLSGCLLTGDITEVVSAARAVWALAANNHRAKLVLRSAGIPTAVQSILQRLQKNSTDETQQRAIELLTYTQTVLQAT